jgi:predicted ester cyclase
MSSKKNKETLRRYVDECWNEKNLSILGDLITPDCPHHMNGPVNFKGPEGFRMAIEQWTKAFPDIKVNVELEMWEGDTFASRGTLTGTHRGELKFPQMRSAIPPTGKKIELEFACIHRMADGKIAETWDVLDTNFIRTLSKSK